jgi:aspartate racemase
MSTVTQHDDSFAESFPSNSGILSEPRYRFPTTLAQQALWYLDQLEPGNPAWNIAVRFRVRGRLDLVILQSALNEIVRRHEILRTTFSFFDDELTQTTYATAALPLPLHDMSSVPPSLRDAAEERLTIREAETRFQLKTGPLIRARVLRFGRDDHMLLVTMHHIVSDGWSIGVFTDELAACYENFLRGKQAPLPDLTLQYADYTLWQKARSTQPGAEAHRAYWKNKLSGLSWCEIPPQHGRPTQPTHNGYILSVLLTEELTASLSAYARTQNSTLYIVALTALMLLIHHHAHQDDISVGTLFAGRDRVELEPLMGAFINTVLLRTDLSGDPSFREALSRVRTTFEEALAHQEVHFLQAIQSLKLRRDPSRPALYSINFIYQRDFVKPVEFAGLTLTPVPSKSPGAIYDLNFFMVRRTDGWRLSCEYNCDLYDAAFISLLLGQLRSLFQQIVEIGGRLSEFAYPADAGDPLPPFVPRSSDGEGPQAPQARNGNSERTGASNIRTRRQDSVTNRFGGSDGRKVRS